MSPLIFVSTTIAVIPRCDRAEDPQLTVVYTENVGYGALSIANPHNVVAVMQPIPKGDRRINRMTGYT